MVQKKTRVALTGLLLLALLACFLGGGAKVQQGITDTNRIIAQADTQGSEGKPKGASERLALLLEGKGLGPRLVVFVLAMLPISELRGAVPVGVLVLKLPWLETSLIALAGNLVPIIPILLFLDAIMRLLGRIKILGRFFDWLKNRAQRKQGLIERYEYLGLFMFVAVPLPMTGGWTGALIASLLRLPFLPSLVAISLGVVMADILVTSFTLLKWWGLLSAVIILPILWLFSTWLERRGEKRIAK